MAKSPAAIIYNSAGVEQILATEAKLEAVRVLLEALAAEDFATETTLNAFLAAFNGEDFASQTTLAALLSAFNAEDFSSETTLAALKAAFDAEDFATQTTLAALLAAFSAEDFSTETTLASLLAAFNGEDFATETSLAALLAAFNAEDFATQTTLASLLAAFNAEDFATETTLLAADGRLTTIDAVLDSIKDVDGIKKITDQLPVGSNLIGKIQIRNPADDTTLGDKANPLLIEPLGDNDITGSIAALNAFVEVDTHGASMIAAQVLGTWVGTLVGEGSIDGTTWFGISGFQVGGTGVVSATTMNGNFRANVNGFMKMRIRASLWTSGTANIQLNSTVRTGQIPVDGNGNIGVRVVSTAPPAGVAATIIAADNPLTVGIHDTDFIIPNGQTFYLQQLVGGNEDHSKGASIEIIYYDGAVERVVHRDYYNGATHSTVFPDISEARDGTVMVGDGSTKLIRIRRAKFSGTNIAIDGEVYGYTQ